MENEDGTIGPHWTMGANEAGSEKGGLDPVKFLVTMNMMYSDYSAVLERSGVSGPDVYAGLTRAFLMDKDA
jgi:hypothetical protein